MNLDDFKKMEARFQRVQPLGPDSALQVRIREEMGRAHRSQRVARLRSWIGWSSFAVAASLLVVFGILLFNGRMLAPSATETMESGGRQAASEVDEFQPVLAENELRNRVDEGIVLLRNGLPARRYRYEFVDRVVWENPADGAVVEMEIPRDEVVLVPVRTF
jgi:hypothetical protein